MRVRNYKNRQRLAICPEHGPRAFGVTATLSSLQVAPNVAMWGPLVRLVHGMGPNYYGPRAQIISHVRNIWAQIG
jgi:hypothetical protein